MVSYTFYKNTTDNHLLNYLLEEGDRPGREEKKKDNYKETQTQKGLILQFH